MNTKTILGASLVAIFAVLMAITAANAAHVTPRVGYLDILSASKTGNTFSMTLASDVKQIPAGKALDVVTFWGWKIPPTDGEALNVVAITMHHGVNDHQIGVERSTPVQSFHPHKAQFDGAFCLIGISSPVLDFKVKGSTVSVDSSEPWTDGFAATGTIGSRPDCAATGLGITNLDDHT